MPWIAAFRSHLLSTRERLDFIVNNACQTVRRPADFYRHMLDLERAAFMESVHDERTQARIQAMLTTGKPLRN